MKHILSIAIFCISLVLVTACTAPNQQAGPETQLSMPEGRELVTEVQELLKSKGYSVGTIDGIMGNTTKNALRLYQADQNIEPTGVITEETYAQLKGVQKPSGSAVASTLGKSILSGVFQRLGVPSQNTSTTTTQPRASTSTRSTASTHTTATQTTSQKTKIITDGLEPVGPINKPGCQGIENMGYGDNRAYGSLYKYYIALRNTTNITRIVTIEYEGAHRDSGSRPVSGRSNPRIAAGDIYYFELDMNTRPPVMVNITKCM